MEIKKINTEVLIKIDEGFRPECFENFIGQEHIKAILETAIDSSQKRKEPIGHILLAGPSWFGKTSIANVIAKEKWVNIKAITWYAISKPSEVISILNNLEDGDILFIDEIHRLKPNIEEVLYIAMEDYLIDMVMPEWDNVRIPINPFTLIGATTKSESLSQPLKNRFVYNFHFMDYNNEEKQKIIQKYLEKYNIKHELNILKHIAEKVDSVPREIHNLCIKIRDFIISKKENQSLNEKNRNDFLIHSQITEGWMSPLHKKYLDILRQNDRALWIKTIAIQLWVNEKAVEEDIEPLLLKLWKIEKTHKWRVLV